MHFVNNSSKAKKMQLVAVCRKKIVYWFILKNNLYAEIIEDIKMTGPDPNKVYPNENIRQVVFIKNVVKKQVKQQQEVVVLTMDLEQQHLQQHIEIDI